MSRRRQEFEPLWFFSIGIVLFILGFIVYNPPGLVQKGTTTTIPTTTMPTTTTIEEKETEEDGTRYHVVFSTDCSAYHDGLSYILFFSALRVGQPGHVTRIASGCRPWEEKRLRRWFERYVQPLSSRFRVHLTPEFSLAHDGERYDYFNKPFGIRHWMSSSDPTTVDIREDDIIIILDPDMIFLKPILKGYSDPHETIVNTKIPSSSSSSLHRDNDNGNGNSYKKRLVVEHGRPFAQMYGFGDGWRHRFNMTELLGPDSPALLVTQEEAEAYYPAGPPYIATAKDTKKIVWLWSEIMFRGYEQYADLLTEMYCYCMAAAHLRLPHVILTSLMVSDTSIHSGEGWKFIEQMPKHNVCELARRQRHNDGVDDDVATRDGNNFVYPSVMHYCQDYAVGDKWYFQKRYLPNNYFECDGPYLEEPPMDVATRYDYSTVPHRDRKEGSNLVLRNAFAVCAITSMANQAVRHYKERTCGTTFNKKFVNYYQFEMNGQQFPPEAIMMDDENEETERR